MRHTIRMDYCPRHRWNSQNNSKNIRRATPRSCEPKSKHKIPLFARTHKEFEFKSNKSLNSNRTRVWILQISPLTYKRKATSYDFRKSKFWIILILKLSLFFSDYFFNLFLLSYYVVYFYLKESSIYIYII